MKISEKTWVEYINRLFRLNETAGKKMAEYIEKHGTDDVQALTAYAQALVQKYGEGSAELACQMYDAIAEASGVSLPPAEPAAPASCRETAGMVRATRQSPLRLQDGVSRLVKRVAADTTLKNALRDEAEWAWVPHGDTCPFCITLASRGWEPASAKALKGNHAQHIHAHCNCEYAIRFDSSTTIAGYDPDKYLEEYEKANGDINAMRREHYARHKDEINAQKRAAYQLRHPHKDATKPPHKENLDKMSLPQLRKLAKETATEYYRSGLSGISFGEHEVEKAADMLANQGSRTSLKKDIRAMRKKQGKSVAENRQKLYEKTYTGGIGSPRTNLNYIESEEYKAKFSSISDNPKLNRAIYERCKAAVTHQSGKYTEDLSVVDLQGNLIGTTSSKVAYETQYSQKLRNAVLSAKPYSLVSIHDHGTNVPPSGADFVSAGSKKYAFGIVACHDGRVYWYSSAKAKPFLPTLIDDKVDKYRSPPYI